MATVSPSPDPLALEKSQTTAPQPCAPRWRLATRVAFRFCFIYFTIYCLSTQVVGSLINIPNVDIPELSTLPPLRSILFWTAAHVFHISQTLIYKDSGSGDKTFDWVMLWSYLFAAAFATIVWSVLDHKRPSYTGMYKWFRLGLRIALGGQMLTYGFAKFIPLQMPYPSLTRLLEPYGNFSPMAALWYSIGAAPGYEILCGSAELLAGILLLIPGITLLGALVTAGVNTEIFILNMTYDVPVKLLSFQLMLMALFLAAPEIGRLADFFIRNRPVAASAQPRLFRTPRANRIALAVQMVFALWLLGSNLYGSVTAWPKYGGGSPKSPLYGIWNVEKHVIDGHLRSPLLNDYGRWRRIVFDYPEYMNFQRMDDSISGFDAAINTKDQTIALTKDGDKKWKGTLHYQRQSPDQLLLDGDVGGQKMHIQLKQFDRNKFQLVSRGFHWVSEYPYVR